MVIDAEAVSGIDVTGAEMLSALASDLDRDGVAVALAGAVGQVRDVLGNAEIGDDLGHQFPTVQAAVDHLSAQAASMSLGFQEPSRYPSSGP